MNSIRDSLPAEDFSRLFFVVFRGTDRTERGLAVFLRTS